MAAATGVAVSRDKMGLEMWGYRRKGIKVPQSGGVLIFMSLITNAQEAIKFSVREGPDPVCV